MFELWLVNYSDEIHSSKSSLKMIIFITRIINVVENNGIINSNE